MYYYILVLLLFSCFLLKNLNVKYGNSYLGIIQYIVFSTIFIVSSTRFSVGSDYFSYKEIFENESPTEPLFSFVIFLTKLLGGNYSWFVAIIFCLSFGIKLFVFDRLSNTKGFFLCLMLFCSFYYIAYEMNGIRQGVAMSFSLLATYYAYKSKKIYFYASCLAAGLFHYTAFIFLPFYALLKIKLSKTSTIIICALCGILAMNNSFNFLTESFTQIAGNGIISYKIQNYTLERVDENLLFSFSTVRRLFFFFLILFSYEKIEASERMKQIVFWGGFATIIIYLLFSEVGYFSIRLSAYYRIIECIWLSYFPFVFQKKSTRYIIFAFYFAYSLLQIHSALSAENHNLLPIQTVLFG